MQLERYMSLTEAAKAAGKITNGWSFRGTDDNSDLKTLLAMAEINDAEYGIQPDEYDETFYLLAPMGAIGFTEDGGEEIDWLYIPLNNLKVHLPASLEEAEIL